MRITYLLECATLLRLKQALQVRPANLRRAEPELRAAGNVGVRDGSGRLLPLAWRHPTSPLPSLALQALRELEAGHVLQRDVLAHLEHGGRRYEARACRHGAQARLGQGPPVLLDVRVARPCKRLGTNTSHALKNDAATPGSSIMRAMLHEGVERGTHVPIGGLGWRCNSLYHPILARALVLNELLRHHIQVLAEPFQDEYWIFSSGSCGSSTLEHRARPEPRQAVVQRDQHLLLLESTTSSKGHADRLLPAGVRVDGLEEDKITSSVFGLAVVDQVALDVQGACLPAALGGWLVHEARQGCDREAVHRATVELPAVAQLGKVIEHQATPHAPPRHIDDLAHRLVLGPPLLILASLVVLDVGGQGPVYALDGAVVEHSCEHGVELASTTTFAEARLRCDGRMALAIQENGSLEQRPRLCEAPKQLSHVNVVSGQPAFQKAQTVSQGHLHWPNVVALHGRRHPRML